MSQKIDLVCAECNKPFQRYQSQMTKSKTPYCSLVCVGKSKRHGSTLHCALCDTEFYRRMSEQDVGNRVNQFCSLDCYREWRALNRSPDTYLKTGRVHTHRVVAEEVLGRPLTSDEVVHHKDGNKHNNHPSNLVVFPNQSFHARCHAGGMTDEELQRFSLQ
jgi:hypothetical protein